MSVYELLRIQHKMVQAYWQTWYWLCFEGWREP